MLKSVIIFVGLQVDISPVHGGVFTTVDPNRDANTSEVCSLREKVLFFWFWSKGQPSSDIVELGNTTRTAEMIV